MSSRDLRPSELEQLEERGISAVEAERQLAILRSPPTPPRVDRPCVIGDGIFGVEEVEELVDLALAASATRRIEKFVPASGAATRMFEPLQVELDQGSSSLRSAIERFARELDRFAFGSELRRRGGSPDEPEALARLALAAGGLDLAVTPKGLIPFHRYGDASRTAFEEHVAEAATYVREPGGACRLHFTVAEEWIPAFERAAREAQARLGELHEVRFDVTFSVQDASTDTLALDHDGHPFRTPEGGLLLRPGGHGALLTNLARRAGDVIFVKNIDNILPAPMHGTVGRWKLALLGLLLRWERRIHSALEALESRGETGPALAALEELGLAVPPFGGGDRLEGLRSRLDRPIRVCGVVPNEGEPGGGPFWVEGPDGVSPQIVEGAQLGPAAEDLLARTTHFNPVDLVCSLRDRRGAPHDLDRWIDPAAVFVASKSLDGQELRALERPGLWNGAMAGWITVFAEVPGSTFAPVKEVFDLLRPAHQLET